MIYFINFLNSKKTKFKLKTRIIVLDVGRLNFVFAMFISIKEMIKPMIVEKTDIKIAIIKADFILREICNAIMLGMIK